MNTREALIGLGFCESEDRFGQSTYIYGLGEFDLEITRGISKYCQPVFLVRAAIVGRRTIHEIEGHLPVEVESMEQAAAFLVYLLRDTELAEKPHWFRLGVDHQDSLPWRKEKRTTP